MDRLKKYLKYKFKRFIVKYKLFEKSIFKDPFEYTGYETICVAIVRKTINHKDTKYTIAPLSNKRYLVNKTIDIFVILEDSKVEITNHVFNYNIRLSQRDWQRIVYIFDTETEKRRTEMEQEVNSQIKNSLYTVLERISNFK